MSLIYFILIACFVMLLKLNNIIIYSLIAFFISLIAYPIYINLLHLLKVGKQIRDDSTSGGAATIFNKLHKHKAWTPTMWWWIWLLVVWIMVLFSVLLQKFWYIRNSLFTRQETYILLFSFFGMWILWLIDDYLNIKWVSRVKWLSAKLKLVAMFLVSGFLSYWFYFKLWVNYINTWPLNGEWDIWIFYLIFTFIFTVAIVNAININDGLDGLAWWLMILVLFVLAIITFFYKWYLATTIIWIILWSMAAFLWFNINPAKIFMGDSWSLALGGLVASLVYLLNIKTWIFIPFIFMFLLFWIELLSSFLQIFWKKIFKRKLFTIAPFHHLLENNGRAESTIVMKFWLIQWILCAITLILLFYQLHA